MIEVQRFEIYSPGDPSVGIFSTTWCLTGPFFFNDLKEKKSFEEELQVSMSSLADDSVQIFAYTATPREQPAPPAIEWKPGPPDMSGTYLIITRIMKTAELYDQYDPDDSYWDIDEVLFHIGPIPKTPDRV